MGDTRHVNGHWETQQELGIANLLDNKGDGSPVTPARWMNRKTGAGAEDLETCAWIDYKDIKAQVLFCWGSLLRGTSSNCSSVTTPGINGFME